MVLIGCFKISNNQYNAVLLYYCVHHKSCNYINQPIQGRTRQGSLKADT